jgi:hypothetical protein
MRRQIIVAAVAASLLLMAAACKKSDNSNALHQGSGMSANASGAAGSSDSLVIRTTDGTMNLGLVRDTIFMGLTDSVLTLAREDMARDTQETGSAIAGTIERFVKKKVSSALGTRLTYPVTDIDSASYSNGSIKFAYRERRRMAFEDVSQNGHKALASFSPEDAQRFVATVNSAIHSRRGNRR